MNLYEVYGTKNKCKMRKNLIHLVCIVFCFISFQSLSYAQFGGFAGGWTAKDQKELEEKKKAEKAQQEAMRLQAREEQRVDKYDRTLTVVLPILVALAIVGFTIASLNKKKATNIQITQTNEQKDDIQGKLRHLRQLHSDGLISDDDFNKKKNELLDRL